MTVRTADAVAATTPADHHDAKRRARLAAVQGLYQIAQTQCSVKDVLADFRDPTSSAARQDQDDGEARLPIDHDLFGLIITGVTQNLADVDAMIAGAASEKLSVERLELLLRAILRAGVYELHHQTAIPTKIIINDYVDVAHVFFNDREPGLVNAILDRLAKTLR